MPIDLEVLTEDELTIYLHNHALDGGAAYASTFEVIRELVGSLRSEGVPDDAIREHLRGIFRDTSGGREDARMALYASETMLRLALLEREGH